MITIIRVSTCNFAYVLQPYLNKLILEIIWVFLFHFLLSGELDF